MSSPGPRTYGEPTHRRPGARVGAVIAIAVVAGFLVWLLLIRDGDGGTLSQNGEPVELSVDELEEVARDVGYPVYWIGPQQDTDLEVTWLSDGRFYVRYLDDGAPVGDPQPNFFTVGSYPVPDPRAALRDVSEQRGAIVERTDDRDLVVSNEDNPQSVYLAFNDDDEVQVEVFDPDPARAMDIATSGAVVPIAGRDASGP